MKNFIISLLVGSSLFLTGCKSPTAQSVLKDAPFFISITVPPTVSIGVAKQPKAAPYLNSLVTVINSFALGQDLSPDALAATIKSAKIKELQTPEALNVINAVVALYKTYYNTAVTNKIASVENLTPILKALADAIEEGLSAPVSP